MKPKPHLKPNGELYKKYYISYRRSSDGEHSEDYKEEPAPEIQEKIISECKKIDCAYRFVNELPTDSIKQLFNGDKFFPFSPPEDEYKRFFKCVHPAFIAPYIIYAQCAYQAVKDGKFTASDLYNLFYHIEVPIQFPRDETYYWYLQKSRLLAIDEEHSVTRHINIYILLRPFTEFEKSHEHKLIQGSFIHENSVSIKFQEILVAKVREYYKEKVLKKRHWKVIEAIANGEKLSSIKEITMPTIYSYTKEINQLITEHTGHNFLDIEDVVEFLQSIRVV
jgi:hypothetical protein